MTINVCVCTPCRDFVRAGYTYDLVYLLAQTPDCMYSVVSDCTVLPDGRNLLVERALPAGAQHVLFIDSDMRFSPDSLNSLLEHKKDIIGANYRERKRDLPTASFKGERIYSKDKTGLQQAGVVGMGFCLIKAEVFYSLEPPWFSTPWAGERHITDDVYFCHKAAAAGYFIWIDHDVSHNVRHIGTSELGP